MVIKVSNFNLMPKINGNEISIHKSEKKIHFKVFFVEKPELSQKQ